MSFYVGDPDAGGTLIASTPTAGNIERGGSERVCVDWVDAPTEPTEVYVRVDAEDGERECIEDNNTVSLGELRCEGIL